MTDITKLLCGATTGGWTMHAKIGQWSTRSLCGREVGASAFSWPPRDGRDACKTCQRIADNLEGVERE